MPDSVMYGLVSDQAAANLLPAMQIKPGLLILLHSARMIDKAVILRDLLKERGLRVELSQLDCDTDFERIKEQVVNHLADAKDGVTHVFNVTGGTKLMAMALLDASGTVDTSCREVVYLDFDSAALVRLDQHVPPMPIDARISLKDYLRAYGIRIEKTAQSHPDWHADEIEAFRNIASRIPYYQPAISRLNGLAAHALESHVLSTELKNPDTALNELLDVFDSLGKLKVNGMTLRFHDAEALNYVKGGWLEHFVFHAIADVQGDLGITDKYNSVEFTRSSDSSVRNEVDSLFMLDARVYVLECKTSRMQGAKVREKANDQLHKLANLAVSVGGLGARSAFVSLQNLNDFEKRLAKQMGITVIHGSDLKDLKGALKKWIRPKT